MREEKRGWEERERAGGREGERDEIGGEWDGEGGDGRRGEEGKMVTQRLGAMDGLHCGLV